MAQTLAVGGRPWQDYVRAFEWNRAVYNPQLSLQELAAQISKVRKEVVLPAWYLRTAPLLEEALLARDSPADGSHAESNRRGGAVPTALAGVQQG